VEQIKIMDAKINQERGWVLDGQGLAHVQFGSYDAHGGLITVDAYMNMSSWEVSFVWCRNGEKIDMIPVNEAVVLFRKLECALPITV
jgi:hypothetical protein